MFVKNLVDEKREEVRKVTENRMPVNEVNKLRDQWEEALEKNTELKAEVAKLTGELENADGAKDDFGSPTKEQY